MANRPVWPVNSHHQIFYTPLAYITHLTDSCAFSKFAYIEGRGDWCCVKVFADFQVLVGYFKITNQTLDTLEKTRHFKIAIAAERKVVLSFRKQI